jgi:hypothetical protein
VIFLAEIMRRQRVANKAVSTRVEPQGMANGRTVYVAAALILADYGLRPINVGHNLLAGVNRRQTDGEDSLAHGRIHKKTEIAECVVQIGEGDNDGRAVRSWIIARIKVIRLEIA